jgi:pseudouridine synthase
VEDSIRLNKFLSEAGVCSRRKADRLIEAGEVTVNGTQATIGGQVIASDIIYCQGQLVVKSDRDVLLLFNKPRGIVCTAEEREKHNVINYINYPFRIYPVGRLDKDSEGLLLMTNQGDLVNKIMRAGNFHEKEYVVRVNKKITTKFLEQMRKGVPILDTVTRPCKVNKVNDYIFTIILTQGLNRQIRRMCNYLGTEVLELRRERIMNFKLEKLLPGEYREATAEELAALKVQLADSTSLSWQERTNIND